MKNNKGHKLKSIWRLSLSRAKAEFKLKNEGTLLGPFWYLLSPILMLLLLLGIFSSGLGKEIPSYPLYLFLGIIIFNYFKNITTESVKSIRDNAGFIKSINFPRESLIGSIILKNFFSHLFEIILLVILLIHFNISLKMMIFYPIIFIFLSIFCAGIALIISSLGTHIYDLDNIWIFFSMFLWLATPIFYSAEIQGGLSIINLMNPLFYFITISRDLIIHAKIPEISLIIGAIFYSLFFFILGLFIFNKIKIKFAELI